MKVIALLFLVAAFTATKAADMIETIEFRTSDCEDCGMTFTGTVSLKVSWKVLLLGKSGTHLYKTIIWIDITNQIKKHENEMYFSKLECTF